MPRSEKKLKKPKKIDYKKKCRQLEDAYGCLKMEHILSVLALNVLKAEYDRLHIAYHELEAQLSGVPSVPPVVAPKKKGHHVN